MRPRTNLTSILAPPRSLTNPAFFIPKSVTGLTLWLKADTLTLTDGVPVALWADSGPNQINLSATGTAQPTFKANVINGRSVVRFNGSSNVLTAANAPGLALGSFTAFVVFQQLAIAPQLAPIVAKNASTLSGNPVYGLALNDSSGQVGEILTTVGGVAKTYLGTSHYSNNTWSITQADCGGGLWRLFRNNAADGSGTATGNLDASTGTLQVGGLTGSLGGSSYFQGDVAEVLLYSPTLATADAQRVYAYLNARWNKPPIS